MATELQFPITGGVRPFLTRPEVRKHAVRFGNGLRDRVKMLERNTSPRPEPRTLFEDVVKKGRGKEETVLGAVIAVVADPNCPDEQVDAIADWFRTELLKYRATLRALPDYADAWKHETEMNGEGNNAEQDFLPAYRTRNVSKMHDIIAVKQRELRAGKELVLCMIHACATVEQSNGRRA